MNGPLAQIRTLTDPEGRAFLATQQVGRIAFALHDRVHIEPLLYAYDGQWLFARTSMGVKLATLAHHPWCAFEVDEVRSPFEWTSVVVRGSVHVLDPETGSSETYGRALDALRALVPETFRDDDPVPQRSILLGVFIQTLEGRQATGIAPRG